MDTVDILKICLRRWYVMLPILLGAMGVSYQMVQAQETTFTAATSYGLVQPGTSRWLASEPRQPPRRRRQRPGRRRPEARTTPARRGAAWQRRHARLGPGGVDNDSSYSVQIPEADDVRGSCLGRGREGRPRRREPCGRGRPGIARQLQSQVDVPAEMRYEPFILAPTQSEALPSTSGKKLVVAVMGVGVLMGAAWSIMADRALRRLGPVEAARPCPGPASSSGRPLRTRPLRTPRLRTPRLRSRPPL